MSHQQNSVKEIADFFLSGNGKYKKVIFMVGAGISTSCGIPDFRSPKTGLYHNLSALNLPFAEAVFDVEFYENNPKPFYLLAKELYPGNFEPSKFHYLMKLFESKDHLHRIYTQNIDTLESLSGIPSKYVIEAHGSFSKNHCIRCKKEYDMDIFKSFIEDYQPTKTNDDKGKNQIAGKNVKSKYLKCDKCNGLIKPKIVFFGENLPAAFFEKSEEDFEKMSEEVHSKCQDEYLVIVAGTSLTVHPFASLPEDVPRKVQRVLVNLEKVGDFSDRPRKQDIFVKSSTDEFADNLVDALDWRKEYLQLLQGSSSPRLAESEKIAEKENADVEDLAAILKSTHIVNNNSKTTDISQENNENAKKL